LAGLLIDRSLFAIDFVDLVELLRELREPFSQQSHLDVLLVSARA
jgi:hypothetical protein